MKILSAIIIFLSLSFTVYSQRVDLNNYCAYTTKYDSIKSLNKLIKKAKWTRDNLKAAQICFAIANRYRLQKDSASQYWYYRAINEFKKHYTKERRAEMKTNVLYVVALSYYFRGQYTEARTYFSKTIVCKAPYNCAYYYIGIIDMILKEYNEAVPEFEKFHSLTGQNVDELINTCKNH